MNWGELSIVKCGEHVHFGETPTTRSSELVPQNGESNLRLSADWAWTDGLRPH